MHLRLRTAVLLGLVLLTLPALGSAQSSPAINPLCTGETASYDPGNGQDIVVPPGYKVSVFAKDLNFPTGIAFRGGGGHFQVFVLESGHGLPSKCNDETAWPGGEFAPDNPFTPDILVFDAHGNKIGGPLAKPTANGGGFQPHGPAIDIAFEPAALGGRGDWEGDGEGGAGARLFATDSNQATHGGGQNNSSRIVIVNPDTGHVTPFITGLPTGDHPTEQLAFKDGYIYWSQGSTTNSGVLGRDNNNGLNEWDIPCQDITLSGNAFDSGGGVMTSGYAGHDSAVLVGVPERIRHSVCARQSCPAGRAARGRRWRGRAGRAAGEQRPGRPAAGSDKSRRHPGLPRLAGPIRLRPGEPGGVQPCRRAGRRRLPDHDAGHPC